jgi:hypothetical protein
MSLSTTALKTELQADPVTYGYAALLTAGNHTGICALINKLRDGTDGKPAISIKRSDVSASEVMNAIDVADYAALPTTPTNAQLSTERRFLSWLGCVCGVPDGRIRLVNDDNTDAPAVKNFKAMFAAGTGTLTRLSALSSRTGSRAEVLGGPGTVVREPDIALALAS